MSARDSSKRLWVMPLCILGAAFLLRFLFVLHLRSSPLADVPMRDEFTIVEWARSLASGDWLGGDVFFRAPLYPYVLGATFRFFNGSLFAARVVQASFASLVPPLVYLLGRRIFGRREAVIAAIATAVYPVLIYFSNELLIVSLAVLLDILVLLLVVRADERRTWGAWLFAGLAFGLAAVARPNVLLFGPFLFVWMWLRARDEGRTAVVEASRGDASPAPSEAQRSRALLRGLGPALRRVVPVVIGAAVVILPVTVRNYVVGSDFVPIASQGGINFFIGNNLTSDGASAMLPGLGTNWEYDDATRAAEREEGRPLKPSEVSAYWYRMGRAFLSSHPGRAFLLYIRKLVLFWDSHEIGSNKDIYYFGAMSPIFRAFSWLGFLVVAPLGLLGMVVTAGSKRGGLLLTLFVLSYMASVVVFFVNARFRLPVVPPLLLLAAAGATWLIDSARARQLRPTVAGAVLVCVAAVFVGVDFYGTHVSGHAHTHYTIGLALASQGRYDEAIDEYRQAIEMWPDYASAYDAMGRSLESEGRLREAFEAYVEASRKNHAVAEAPLHAGVLMLRRGDMEAGVEWLREAVRRDASIPEAQYYLASTLAGLGRLKEAEDAFRAALTADRDYAEAWDGLGRVLEDTGRPAEALSCYETAIRLDPSLMDARNDAGVVLAKLGRYGESLAVLETALRLSPDDERLRANLERVRQLAVADGNGGGP